jgi:CubicO group peptidase (beta-lactamase class C family)
MGAQEQIDAALNLSVSAGETPGVVAMLVDDQNTLYEGAFGKRGTANTHPMTMDTVFWYASMTKALVSAGAVQLLEQGKFTLDEPASRLLPDLASPMVLEGFDKDGKPKLRPARRPITPRHLLTHTSGFAYDIWNVDNNRFMIENGIPLLVDCKKKSLHQPLAADPGERWEYGISTDWVGQLVEAVSGQDLRSYLRKNLFDPIGMDDCDFIIGPDQKRRRADVHQRAADGSLTAIEHEINQKPEFFMGGGGCYGTARDYALFVQTLLNQGRAKSGAQIFKPETVKLMGSNCIGDIEAGVLNPHLLDLALPTNFFPGMSQKWGLSFLLNTQDASTGRSAWSMSWAGLANSYYWIDPKKRLGGVIMTQILPFGDPLILKLYETVETIAYRAFSMAPT